MRQALALVAIIGGVLALRAAPAIALEGSANQTYPIRLSGWCESVANDRARTTKDGGVFRIRPGAALNATANRQTIMVEQGGTLTYVGRASSIYVENDAFARIIGDANTIIMQPRAKVSSSGANTMTMVRDFDVKLNPNAELCR
jgi:hypothetical protein